MAPTNNNKTSRVKTRSVTGANHKLTVNVKNNLSKVTKNKQSKVNAKQTKVSGVITKSSNPVVATARGKGKGRLQASPPQSQQLMDALQAVQQLCSVLQAGQTANGVPQAPNQTAQQTPAKNKSVAFQNKKQMESPQAIHVVTDVSNDFMGVHYDSDGASNRSDQIHPVDDNSGPSREDVELDNINDQVDMDIDEEDIPPPPPSRQPADHVAAESAPQSALDLLTSRDTPGKRHKIILGKFVKHDIRRKIWAHTFVDFSDLLDKDKDDAPLHVINTNGLLSFKKAKVNKVDGWALWNKAFRVFTEIYCLKYPAKCIDLVQYSGILNNLAGKFPFAQVYNYDKEFRQELEEEPQLQWNKIDQQIWAVTLHGIHTINQGHQQQSGKFSNQGRQQFKKRTEWPFRHCYDHSRGGCNHPSCTFPHICGICGSHNHTTPNCPQYKGGQATTSTGHYSQQGSSGSSSSQHSGRRPIRATHTTQGGSTANASSGPPTTS